jgi:hypothetical protein
MARAKNDSAQHARIECLPGESNSERGSGQAPTDQRLDIGKPARAARAEQAFVAPTVQSSFTNMRRRFGTEIGRKRPKPQNFARERLGCIRIVAPTARRRLIGNRIAGDCVQRGRDGQRFFTQRPLRVTVFRTRTQPVK